MNQEEALHSEDGEEDFQISIQPDAARTDFLRKHAVRAKEVRD